MSLNIYSMWKKHSSYTRKIRCFNPRISEQRFSLFSALVLAQLITLFVTFLRKVRFVVSTYSICSGLENQTVTDVYNTNLQSSRLLQGLYLSKLLLTWPSQGLAYCVTLAGSGVPWSTCWSLTPPAFCTWETQCLRGVFTTRGLGLVVLFVKISV